MHEECKRVKIKLYLPNGLLVQWCNDCDVRWSSDLQPITVQPNSWTPCPYAYYPSWCFLSVIHLLSTGSPNQPVRLGMHGRREICTVATGSCIYGDFMGIVLHIRLLEERWHLPVASRISCNRFFELHRTFILLTRVSLLWSQVW